MVVFFVKLLVFLINLVLVISFSIIFIVILIISFSIIFIVITILYLFLNYIFLLHFIMGVFKISFPKTSFAKKFKITFLICQDILEVTFILEVIVLY